MEFKGGFVKDLVHSLPQATNVSDNEIEFLTNKSAHDEKNVRTLWHDGLKLLLVTDGKEGCRYFTNSFKGKVGGFLVKTVDTTGAGDAFVGSILFSIAQNPHIFEDEDALKKALSFANACGALCTTKKGAIPALPTPDEAKALMATEGH